MNKIEHGGDAFPCSGNPECDQMLHGMSLRDWFAGMALQGWIASFGEDTQLPDNCVPMAGLMYKVADAMIKAKGE